MSRSVGHFCRIWGAAAKAAAFRDRGNLVIENNHLEESEVVEEASAPAL
jgi:hypothetical protein